MEKLTVEASKIEISEVYEEAVKVHQQIMANSEVAANALLELCKNLKKMRDEKLYTELGFDTFDNYCEGMAGIKTRMAYNYISTYERLGTTVLQSNANLGITKLELIAGMNPDQRADLLADGSAEEMSVSEIKELVKKNKEQGEQISLLQERIEELETAELEEHERSSAEFDVTETDEYKKLMESYKQTKKELEEASEYDAEKDEMYDRIKDLEKELAEARAHKNEPEDNEDNSAEIQKQVDAAVKSAVKNAKNEAKAEAKKGYEDKLQKQEEKIKALESAIASATAEKDKLTKQLAVSDENSAKAMVYVQAIQDNFNALFHLINQMETEQQNKFKGAVLKLTAIMSKQAEV